MGVLTVAVVGAFAIATLRETEAPESASSAAPAGTPGEAPVSPAPRPAPTASEAPAGEDASVRRRRAQRDDVRRRIYEAFWRGEKEANRKRGAPTAALPPRGVPPSKVGKLDKDYIQSRIREDFKPLAVECYEAALARVPDLAGKLVLEFVIVGDESVGGVVESVDVSDKSTMAEKEFVYCIRESMLSMTFEPPESGGSVTVTYPFVFRPGDGG